MPWQILDVWDKIRKQDLVKTDIPEPENNIDPVVQKQEAERKWNSGVTMKCGITVGFNKFRDIPGNLWNKIIKKG